MLYWISRSIGSSMRLYFETIARMPGSDPEGMMLAAMKSKVPSAIAMFPHELLFGTKELCQNAYTLRRFTEFEHGGHFAGLEKPSELVHDIKSFFLADLGLGPVEQWKRDTILV